MLGRVCASLASAAAVALICVLLTLALPQRVASVLLQRGRLSLRELMRFLATSSAAAAAGLSASDKISAGSGSVDIAASAAAAAVAAAASAAASPLKSRRLVQQTLLILVQHGLCWHVRLDADGMILDDDNDDDAGAGTEWFEMNADAILPRVRLGRYVDIAEAVGGSEARDVVRLILQNGRLQASDVIERLGDGDAKRECRVRERTTCCLTRCPQARHRSRNCYARCSTRPTCGRRS
jgi:DNA-directed RNA polymerase III subunit RPC3